ncbi:MAG: tetratricopeptide repeat protein [Rubrivivax sp.]
MDFDLPWLQLGLLVLPAAFALGWIAARLDLRQLRGEQREAPRAYFRGLSLLLNEQQDKAVDAFIEAVRNDPDAVELHFALGNLFRRRGEFERAVRVHEHLLARADLPGAERDRARHALAQDYLRAGLFDRAEAAFTQLRGTGFEAEADLALLALHERSREWPAAIEAAERLQGAGRGDFSARIAHFECERAELAHAQHRPEEAAAALARARRADPRAARPWLLQARWHESAGEPARALAALESLREAAPAFLGLVAADYARLALATGQGPRARETLEQACARDPGSALVRARLLLEAEDPAAQAALLAEHLRHAPGLAGAQALLALSPAHWGEAGLQGLRTAVERAAAPLQRHRCAACGFEARHWFWQCPGCLGWDTFPPRTVEEL